MEIKSILDIESQDRDDNSRPVIRRKRAKCATCGTPMYLAIGTPDEQRTSCRYCLHTGWAPISTVQS